MKQMIALLFLMLSLSSYGQDGIDFENLVKLGEIYSKNVNATVEEFKMEVDKLRTPELNHIIETLLAVGDGDKKLLTKEFLSKPSFQELKYWYVLREIHYNNQSDLSERRLSNAVAKESLEKDIDSRWLLDNYYYRIRGGIAKLFNDKDLSEENIDLEGYGLENDTEKAILFFAVSTALIQRFQVLLKLKNYDKLLEFANKIPTFNSKPYYEFRDFDFEDFDWIGYDKTESYKESHLSNLYLALFGHFSALSEKGRGEDLRNLYFNSILFVPGYFKYSGVMDQGLQDLYNKSKK
jgi:hypothetical protein